MDNIIRVVDESSTGEEFYADVESYCFDLLMEEKPKVKPKELLKNGMFVLSQDNDWYVKVDNNFVGESGGFNTIDFYDDDLCWHDDSYFCINAIVVAKCFDSAKRKYNEGEVVWKRTK